MGSAGAYNRNLIVGARAGETTLDGTATYSSFNEVAAGTTRYRFVTAGSDQNAAGTATAKALFVGQGVDGPLGVIGTWTLNDNTVGRVSPDGSHTDDFNAVPIYGAFGAQVP